MMQKKSVFYRKYLKRTFDFLVALIAIIMLFPALLVIALLVKIELGNPVFFKQKRPGLNEKIFTMYKFRTMTEKKDSTGKLLPDEERLLKFGNFLRSTSLDELPELFNILRGDMSFIGPRPLLTQYLSLYNEHQRRRHEVRPGLTGLAQVSGRNAISWEEKFNLDVQYVDQVSFIKDAKIFFLTVKKVLCREGIYTKNDETPNYFQGNKHNNEGEK